MFEVQRTYKLQLIFRLQPRQVFRFLLFCAQMAHFDTLNAHCALKAHCPVNKCAQNGAILIKVRNYITLVFINDDRQRKEISHCLWLKKRHIL